MANNPAFYFDVLYPFQDRVIQAINQADTGFYLTGETAASRGYLHHRFSDDLDYFVNDDSRFGLWVERIIQTLNREWKCDVLMKDERFARLSLDQKEFSLKIEMVNDVPAHVCRRHSKSSRPRTIGQRRKHPRQQSDRAARPRGAKGFRRHLGILLSEKSVPPSSNHGRAKQSSGRLSR